MSIETTERFDSADYLDTPEMIAAYLEVSFEEAEGVNDITDALRTVARSKGMTALAERTGITREGLYKAFGPKGNPRMETIMAFMKALGVRLAVVPVTAPEHEAA